MGRINCLHCGRLYEGDIDYPICDPCYDIHWNRYYKQLIEES